MIQTLQKLKAKKGFTIVELVVVLAIIAVLVAVIVPGLSTRKAKISEANSAARDFYTAVQSIMTKYSLYDGPLSAAYMANPDLGDIRYFEKLGGNYPYKRGTTAGDAPATASLYIEVCIEKGLMTDVVTYTAEATETVGMYQIATRNSNYVNNECGRLLKAELENRIHYRDGYYYAKVKYESKISGIPSKMEAETVKVEYAGFCVNRLPLATGGVTNYINENLTFGAGDYELNNGEVFGVFAKHNGTSTVGLVGTTLN